MGYRRKKLSQKYLRNKVTHNKSDKAAIEIMIFVTNNESSKVLKPCEKVFNFPSLFVTS